MVQADFQKAPLAFVQLCTLLRGALYGLDVADFPPLADEQWAEVVSMARRQTVSGLLLQGVSALPEGYPFPEDLMSSLVADTGHIRQRGYKVALVAQSLLELYRGAGLHPVVMKGPAVAQYYPDPLLRQSGDIDLFFPEGEYDTAVSMSGKTVRVGDGSLHFMQDGVDVDLHRRYFDLHMVPDLSVPSPEATLLMLSSHILKHAMGPGIGLRQLCDLAVAYRKLSVPRETLREVFVSAGLEKWNRMLFAFLTDWLGAEPLYEDGAEETAPLMTIILSGGNFGHYASRRHKALAGSVLRRKTDTLLRYVRRLPFSLRYAPRELLYSLGALFKGNLSR
ncbi:MAG: nucleotidyltransferase family protein [Bacteroidales bacterium]|nr:nucleotidyltransferase family protein [Bacteroidales bacterium]